MTVSLNISSRLLTFCIIEPKKFSFVRKGENAFVCDASDGRVQSHVLKINSKDD